MEDIFSFFNNNMIADMPTLTKYWFFTVAIEWLLSGYWVAIVWLLSGYRIVTMFAWIIQTRPTVMPKLTHKSADDCLNTIVTHGGVAFGSNWRKYIYWKTCANRPVYISIQSGFPLRPPISFNTLAALLLRLCEECFLAARAFEGDLQSASPFHRVYFLSVARKCWLQ